jgi:hypothetical protein
LDKATTVPEEAPVAAQVVRALQTQQVNTMAVAVVAAILPHLMLNQVNLVQFVLFGDLTAHFLQLILQI